MPGMAKANESRCRRDIDGHISTVNSKQFFAITALMFLSSQGTACYTPVGTGERLPSNDMSIYWDE